MTQRSDRRDGLASRDATELERVSGATLAISRN